MTGTFATNRVKKMISELTRKMKTLENIDKMNELINSWSNELAEKAIENAIKNGRKQITSEDIKFASSQILYSKEGS